MHPHRRNRLRPNLASLPARYYGSYLVPITAEGFDAAVKGGTRAGADGGGWTVEARDGRVFCALISSNDSSVSYYILVGKE